MAVRVVEWKKPYTWGKAITVDENKVISLNLRAENNLIIYDEWDDEIYVDLQLPDWIHPTYAFPVGITTGRVNVADDWDAEWTIVVFKTTSWDNIKLFYSDNVLEGGVVTEDWKLYIDNWSWTFKQIYFKSDVDSVIAILQQQIDTLTGLGKFLSSWDASTGEPVSFPLSTPYTYTTWDWYLVWIADQTTNYRPAWDEWVDDDPSATRELETEIVEVWDVYIYDGIVWILQKNTLAAGSWDVIWPVSATDGHLAVFDWVTGKVIKDGWAIPDWVPSWWTVGQVLTQTANWPAWDNIVETVVSGDSWTTYTIKVANSDPTSWTPATTITFVV